MNLAPLPLYDPVLTATQADPYPSYARLRENAPVYYVASIDAYAVSRHADVRRVMHDAETFSSSAMAALVDRPVEYSNDPNDPNSTTHATSIIGTDGAQHNRLRLIVNRGFTPRRIAQLEDEIRHIAQSMVAELLASGSGDLQAGLAVPLPMIVIAEMLGVPAARRDDFRRWSEDMVRAVFEPPDVVDRGAVARSSTQMTDWIESVVAARAAQPGDDLISVLLRAEAEGGALSREELLVFVFTLLIAGSITSAYLIGSATEQLVADPDLDTAVRSGEVPVPALVEETLRFEAPTQMMFRTATRDVEVAGSVIPQGATIAALLGSANRDTSVFDDPEHFDARRETREHLTFGHGGHFCLGAALARIEARITLEELLAQTRGLEPAGPSEHVASMVFRGPVTLPLRYQ
jgi:cytochrome P450